MKINLQEVKELILPVISPRQPFSKVEASIQRLNEEEYGFVIHWAKVIAVSNIELCYTFLIMIGNVTERLDSAALEMWVNKFLSIYDQEGLYPAIKTLKDIAGFQKQVNILRYGCSLEEIKPKLNLFIRGLNSRALEIKDFDVTYTDTVSIYLPKRISVYKDKKKNLSLYKAMACFLWAQNWYGTFKRENYNTKSLKKRLDKYKDNTHKAEALFLSLENIRLMANIERDLPGLYREITWIAPLSIPNDNTWKVMSANLENKNATVEDTFKALDVLIQKVIKIPQTSYQGSLNSNKVEYKIQKRKQSILNKINNIVESNQLGEQKIADILQSLKDAMKDSNTKSKGGNTTQDGEKEEGQSYDSREGDVPDELIDLLNSLLQDVDQIQLSDFKSIAKQDKQEGESVLDKLEETICNEYMDEWDYLRQNYRQNWCRILVKDIVPIDNDFKNETKRKYPYISSKINKVFEAMRDLPKIENKQTDGEEIDFDAVVEMYEAKLSGQELSERVYKRRIQNNRDVAVCLLVDMSGSTKGWINLAIRESVTLFGQALNTLGDQYSIIGFSGLTRQRCEIFNVKRFEDKDTITVFQRIANIQARDYTRMGFAVRYASKITHVVESKHKIILLLSDGKPDDYDGYQGEYGIQDTRKAIVEAQGKGIKVFSITVDKQAQQYLPKLFGPGQYTILNDVKSLPEKLTEIYRKLSS